MKPVVLQVGELPEWDQNPLNSSYQMIPYYKTSDKAELLAQYGADIRAVVTRGELGADRNLIDACPATEIISVYGVGYDAVAVDYCSQKGIAVTNTPDVLTGDVADLGIAMLLCLQRDMISASQWVRQGNWTHQGNHKLGTRVHGQRIGILGLGRIGFEVARRLEGFDVDISYCDTEEKAYAGAWTYVADAVELATDVDVLFVTLAASQATHHFVGTRMLHALGERGVLVNISRASNIDEAALLSALESGKLGSAAIDVFHNEPDINLRWLELDNVLLQPHHASGTLQTRQAMGKLLRGNLTAHFAGEPLLTPVLPEDR